jgi:hypothetical protein
MSTFDEALTELMAKAGKMTNALARERLLQELSGAREAHEAELKTFGETQAKELQKLKEQYEEDLERLELYNAETEVALEDALAVLWKTSDGRAIIERAFVADPKRTKTELNYIGGADIAGELSVNLDLRRKM